MKNNVQVVVVMLIILAFPLQTTKGECPIQDTSFQSKVLTTKTEPMVVSKMDITTIEYFKVELTAYCNCYICTQNTSNKGHTASGVIASRGTLAVPRNIPFGTIIYINGEPCRAEDRGGAIKVSNETYVIDVWMQSHQEALKFGRVKTKMYFDGEKYFINY